MSLSIVQSRAEQGITAREVCVEVHLTGGLPRFSIVGLPEAAVRESRDRVRSALISCNFEFPRKKITVNLAPADLPKDGGRYDLPIAIGILAAAGQLAQSMLNDKVFIGELALTGALRVTRGALVTALSLRNSNWQLCLPIESARQASLVPDVQLLPASHLLDVISGLKGESEFENVTVPNSMTHSAKCDEVDVSDIKGQVFAKRALIIAAVGGHNLLLYGPPGTGKSMLAQRFIGLLPELTIEQALQAAAVTSISDEEIDRRIWRERPFRNPHHSASAVSIVGGGSKALPGEISLAHNGVLFLDEFPEFDKKVLENLREPLESGTVSIARAAYRETYPADFILIAAMNPCNCGYLGDAANSSRCRCSPDQIRRYRAKLSGPLLDRIDMHVEVPRVPQEILTAPGPDHERTSEQIRKEVVVARALQIERQGVLNNKLAAKQIDEICALDKDSQTLINMAMNQLGLSARAYHRILKLARSVADLAGSERIIKNHLAQAIQLRSLDRAW